MVNLDELIKNYYDKFVNLPSNKPIVRQNQINDAFEIVVLEALYGEEKEINVQEMNDKNVEELSKYIVAPPDAGIDIVVKHEDIDESSYVFIQVKNTDLPPVDIERELEYMKKTIRKYLENPSTVSKNLSEILHKTCFSESDKLNCKYVLVHRGNNGSYKGQDEEIETIITGEQLERIISARKYAIPVVPAEKFNTDSFNNFSMYQEAPESPAILMNIRGYDLAKLANNYVNTKSGRSILFGQNLRESLSKSKTYDGMADTIRKEPEKFWFYNNGITIIAEDYDLKKDGATIAKDYDLKKDGEVDQIILKKFSIINGAQTTSTLGRFLKNAQLNDNVSDEEKLKKVFVLARILKVEDNNFKNNIAIYNNTQNPITTRDMVSNREEQIKLYEKLLNGDGPHIFMEIRRGMTLPSKVRNYKHQISSNVELAQLAFAGFKRDPFTAKNNKNSFFNKDYKDDNDNVLLNESYDQLFNPEKGILFSKTKEEIDELLFVYFLYKKSKKKLVKIYSKKIDDFKEVLENCNDDEKKEYEEKIINCNTLKEIANICVFYCVTCYYSYKKEFPKEDSKFLYKYKEFYENEKFEDKLVDSFINLFLEKTIQIIKELTEGTKNIGSWIKAKESKDGFLKKINDDLQTMKSEEDYKKYVKDFKSERF